MTKYFMGIDTSCYTTSLAIIDEDGRLAGDYRIPLEVDAGKIGLRQSEGFFKHVQNLPVLYEQLVSDIDPLSIEAVGVSSQPRNVNDSYMPVFTAGVHFAKTIALSIGKSVIEFSHQEGHIEASKWSSHFQKKDFMALHLSGGTSELLSVQRVGIRYIAEIVGGVKDISAGKLIDRSGVYMGAPFPAGKTLDTAISFSPKRKFGYPTSVKEGWINFSGLENVAKKKYDECGDIETVAEGLFEAISKSILKMIEQVAKAHDVQSIIFGGGVTSSKYIQAYLEYHNRLGIDLVFSDPRYAVDNAVGIAELCRQSFQEKTHS